MKKYLSLFLVLAILTLAFVGCGNTTTSDDTTTPEQTQEPADTTADPSATTPEETTASEDETDPVMSHADYIAAELESKVIIEAYVQAKQSWWDNKATVYAQDRDGAYFLYSMACSEEDFAKLVPGTKIRVTGYKSVWSGEIEIIDAEFSIIEGADTFIAEPLDVTSLLGKDEIIDHQNEFVSFKGMTVEAAGQDEDGNDVAFLYKYNGSGKDGDDLYFKVSIDGQTYSFTVESYLCDNTTDVYAAVKALNIGDKIDMEGFLYWYEGVNPHITSVTPSAD